MPNTSYFKKADETDEQYKQRTGFYGPDQAITSDALKPTESLTIPDPVTPKDPSPLATSSIEGLLAAYNAPTKEEEQQGDIISQILNTQDVLGTQATRRKTLEEQAGLPGQRQEVQNIVNQLQGLGKEAMAIPLQIQQEALGRGVTAAGMAPIQSARLRENAIKSLTLAAIGQTLQGNLTLAETNITNALEAEFAPERAKLETLKQIYQFNKDALERIDKKRAENLNILINERERIINAKEAERKLTYDLSLEAARSGAPMSVIEQMRSTTPDRAMGIAAKYLGAEFKQRMEQQAFENGLKTREMQIKEAEYGLNRRLTMLNLAKAGDAAAIKELGYDPNDLPLTPEEVTSFEEQQNLMQRDIDILNNLLLNDAGIEASGGLLRGGVPGAILEAPLGPLGAAYSTAKKQDFLADAGYVIKNITFKKMQELAEQGIKLTPVSERELKAMGDAADALVSAADYDEAGNLRGFRMSEDKMREQFRMILKHYQNAKDDISVNLMLSDEDRKAIIAL